MSRGQPHPSLHHRAGGCAPCAEEVSYTAAALPGATQRGKNNAVFHSAEYISAGAAWVAVKLQPGGTRPVHSSERQVEGEEEHRGRDA